MVDARDIRWLAGLLEGEGCFGIYYLKRNRNGSVHRSPQIRLAMTDRDVMQRAANLMGVGCLYLEKRHLREPKYKPIWTIRPSGSRAIGWMMTLYSLMGQRRQAKIREVIAEWRSVPSNPGSVGAIWADYSSRTVVAA